MVGGAEKDAVRPRDAELDAPAAGQAARIAQLE
jgi:hypothetical protein